MKDERKHGLAHPEPSIVSIVLSESLAVSQGDCARQHFGEPFLFATAQFQLRKRLKSQI